MVVQNILSVKTVEAYIDYRWYSKSGFKPQVGYRHYLPWGLLLLGIAKGV